MEINFIDETNQVPPAQQKEVDSLLQFAADFLNLPEETEMSVTFMNNDAIQEINRVYRQKDIPTDVISFAFEETGEEEMAIVFPDDFPDAVDFPKILGDIMISIDKAKEQANEYGHRYERELGFLAVHGFLHLNGYDHLTPDEEAEMFGLQKEILDAYGLQR